MAVGQDGWMIKKQGKYKILKTLHHEIVFFPFPHPPPHVKSGRKV